MNTDTLSIEALKGYLSSQYKGWSSFVDNVIFPIFGKDKFETLSETELLENNPEENHWLKQQEYVVSSKWDR